jgi:hypothetical protein
MKQCLYLFSLRLFVQSSCRHIFLDLMRMFVSATLLMILSSGPGMHCFNQCCGSGINIPDPNFFHPGSSGQKGTGSRIRIRKKHRASTPMLFQPRRSTLTSPTSCSTTTRRAAPRSWRSWTPRQCCPSRNYS